MINEKKKVKEGEYAILSIKSKLPKGLKPDDLSEEDKSQLQSEE